MKPVVVVLRRGPGHPRTAQGLRAAVGYLSVGLTVEVLLVGAAQALLVGEWPAPVTRPLQLLVALGQRVRRAEAGDVAAALRGARAVVTW